MLGAPKSFWGKLRMEPSPDRDPEIAEWHPLAAHCADVAACFEALLEIPGIRRSFETLGGTSVSPVIKSRLAAIAFLHDLGKLNGAFQSKPMSGERHPLAPGGHVLEAAALLLDDALKQQFVSILPIHSMAGWFDGDGDGLVHMLLASWSHHGTPVPLRKDGTRAIVAWKRPWRWCVLEDGLSMMAQELKTGFGEAFLEAQPIRATPGLQAYFCGIVSLADWIGSKVEWFPFSEPQDQPRLPWARARALDIVSRMGLLPRVRPRSFTHELPFQEIFGFPPNDIQKAILDLPLSGNPRIIAEAA